MKVIIAGSRGFNDYEKLKNYCTHVLQNIQEEIEIVSGTANGADKLGEQYSEEMGYKLTKFPANWDKHGKAAGSFRNKEMAEYADALIAFWDGKSRGTSDMINKARRYKLKIKVLNY
jgi:hypothetical protein